MEDKSGKPVSHIVIGTFRKDFSCYGTVSPAEVIKMEHFATEGIVAKMQIGLLKAEP
jgi:hypothetical protein